MALSRMPSSRTVHMPIGQRLRFRLRAVPTTIDSLISCFASVHHFALFATYSAEYQEDLSLRASVKRLR
jgi:hypothetical protein